MQDKLSEALPHYVILSISPAHLTMLEGTDLLKGKCNTSSTIKKCLKDKDDIPIVLLQIKAIPIDSKLPSPAEVVFEQIITTTLPSRA